MKYALQVIFGWICFILSAQGNASNHLCASQLIVHQKSEYFDTTSGTNSWETHDAALSQDERYLYLSAFRRGSPSGTIANGNGPSYALQIHETKGRKKFLHLLPVSPGTLASPLLGAFHLKLTVSQRSGQVAHSAPDGTIHIRSLNPDGKGDLEKTPSTVLGTAPELQAFRLSPNSPASIVENRYQDFRLTESLQFLPGDKYLAQRYLHISDTSSMSAISQAQPMLSVWDIPSGKEVLQIRIRRHAPPQGAFLQNENRLWVWTSQNEWTIYPLQDASTYLELSEVSSSPLESIQFSDEAQLAYGDDNTLWVREGSRFKFLSPTGQWTEVSPVGPQAFSPQPPRVLMPAPFQHSGTILRRSIFSDSAYDRLVHVVTSYRLPHFHLTSSNQELSIFSEEGQILARFNAITTDSAYSSLRQYLVSKDGSSVWLVVSKGIYYFDVAKAIQVPQPKVLGIDFIQNGPTILRVQDPDGTIRLIER